MAEPQEAGAIQSGTLSRDSEKTEVPTSEEGQERQVALSWSDSRPRPGGAVRWRGDSGLDMSGVCDMRGTETPHSGGLALERRRVVPEAAQAGNHVPRGLRACLLEGCTVLEKAEAGPLRAAGLGVDVRKV